MNQVAYISEYTHDYESDKHSMVYGHAHSQPSTGSRPRSHKESFWGPSRVDLEHRMVSNNDGAVMRTVKTFGLYESGGKRNKYGCNVQLAGVRYITAAEG